MFAGRGGPVGVVEQGMNTTGFLMNLGAPMISSVRLVWGNQKKKKKSRLTDVVSYIDEIEQRTQAGTGGQATRAAKMDHRNRSVFIVAMKWGNYIQ